VEATRANILKMNFYSVALKIEAKPIIDQMLLTKSSDKVFSIYENSSTKLIITGMGSINSSIATTYLLTKYSAKRDDQIVNIGICGCSFNANIGDKFHIDKIIYHNKVELLNKKDGIPHKKITTFDRPQNSKSCAKNSLIDMEAYGFFKASKIFIDKENITIKKVVSDFVSNQNLPKETIYRLINDNL
jgi:purine-nucleoside phosphorylase